MGLGERAFKKAIHTREYRERAQPENRKRLGLLEKHKDYVLRARDYHRKQNALKALRIRAANRNPDEFHFGMIKSRIIVPPISFFKYSSMVEWETLSESYRKEL